MAGRKSNGQFERGNPGGPGRPKRAVELSYLAALSDAVPVETWKEIVSKAVELAKAGDDKSREWLTRHLVGQSASLTLLAKIEAFGAGPGDYVRAIADQEVNPGGLLDALTKGDNGPGLLERAAAFARENGDREVTEENQAAGSAPE